jgi:hypothetical protein
MEDQDGTVADAAPTAERKAEKAPTMKDIVEGLLRTELFAKLRATKDSKKIQGSGHNAGCQPIPWSV